MCRWCAAGLAGILILAGSALAAPGDTLIVTGDVVNLRARPARDAPILLQMYRGQRAIEVGRATDWVELELSDSGQRGWIFGRLVEAVPPAAIAEPPPTMAGSQGEPSARGTAQASTPAPEQPDTPPRGQAPGAVPGGPVQPSPEAPRVGAPGAARLDQVALARFRDSVAILNERAEMTAGAELFVAVRAGGAGAVQVEVGRLWTSIPPADRRSFLNSLYDRWLAAAGGRPPLSLQLVDDQGRVLMEKPER